MRFAPLPEDLSVDPARSESAVLDVWRREGVFAAVQAARAQADPFVFWEGPPTANGRPGIAAMPSSAMFTCGPSIAMSALGRSSK